MNRKRESTNHCTSPLPTTQVSGRLVSSKEQRTWGLTAALIALSLFLGSTTAWSALDNKGTEFILAFAPNFDSGAITELHLTSDTATTATVSYPVNAPTFTTTVPVNPGSVTIVGIPNSSAQGWITNTVQNNAVRASAASEFVAYLINRRPFSSDAALGLPVDTMNTEYIVATYNEAFRQSEFVVVAAFDNTTVTITPSNAADGGHPAGVPYDVVLNRGEGFMVTRPPSGLDGGLAGSIVTSDKPVGMTNGNGCTQVPIGTVACDHIFEVAQPTQTWGNEALVVNLPNRPSGSIYRVLASQDATTITLDGAVVGTRNRGQFLEIGPLSGSHVIAGDKPIYVVQFMTGVGSPGAISGDPAMGNMIPTAQYLNNYTFSTVGGGQFAQHFLTVIAKDSDTATITLDGAPIGAGNFTPIGATGFSSAILLLTEGTHTTSSTNPHGITVEGYNQADSYLYPGGALFKFINPVGDANPPLCNVTISGSPATGSGTAQDNRPSEDTNGNDVLDPGEDLNSNGQIDEDTGVFFIELEPGAANLTLTTNPFVPGAGLVNFTVQRPNPTLLGSGVVRVTDGAGNICQTPVILSAVVDTTPPSCVLTAILPGPPTQIKVTTQDTGSGLASITPLISTNATVTFSLTPGTTDPVVVTGTKIDQSKKAQVMLEVKDVAGNTTTCDPVLTLLVRENGKPVTETLTDIPDIESQITIANGSPGIKNLVVTVNGVAFRVNGLKDFEERSFDVSSAMHEGDNNTITLTAWGKPGSQATIIISE